MNKIHSILVRYLILLIVAIPNLYLFYFIFTPPTVFSTKLLFSLFNVDYTSIQIISACIAGSAYYLLLILNLSTPNIKFKKRIFLILSAFLIFLVLNILRIFFLALLFVKSFYLFGILHKIFWYALSTFFVVSIWFVQVKRYKIKNIPIYSDIKYLVQKTKC